MVQLKLAQIIVEHSFGMNAVYATNSNYYIGGSRYDGVETKWKGLIYKYDWNGNLLNSIYMFNSGGDIYSIIPSFDSILAIGSSNGNAYIQKIKKN